MVKRTMEDLRLDDIYGYKVIYLSKNFALVRNWSKKSDQLRAKIPYYILVKIVKER